MGMYPTKNSADDCFCIDTQWLKQHGYFCGWKSGGITWSRGWSGSESSIGFTVSTMSSPEIKFQYTITPRWDGEKKDMDYSFPLVKVPCNLGGFRWAFKCSLYKRNCYCGRTVYKLYQPDGSDYFGCRKCMNIVYESQRKSGCRLEFFGKALDNERKYGEVYDSIHKWHYQGKPTRKVRKLRRLEARMPSLEESIAIKKSIFGRL
ncbi:hypothetical protein HOG17_03280 [Candidatus Peregrinibacteria bacterium]|jgi:hypothetical protein|nr:hypothetical protein [Candidatus Peregrinibacteria bacterium]MBT4148230.1 hypothetical protein [Candidatus Peregrinibacteria bacterium]MBT4455868.1 hypothetical protein [Candidatus Peregrinibacteria bacterium]